MRSLLCWMVLFPSLATGSEHLRVQQTEIVLQDTVALKRGVEVVGNTLTIPGNDPLRIDSAERDLTSRFKDIWLYRLTINGQSICHPDAAGDERALLFGGRLDDKLNYIDDPSEFSISCVSGVQAKCLRWGYRPWANAPIGGASLAPYYNACLRTARADYCGNDQPTTRDGTAIDLYDRIGIQQPETNAEGFEFEAGWSAAGAICVNHPRIAANASLDQISRSCPRLRQAPLGALCTESYAQENGALLFNRSKL